MFMQNIKLSAAFRELSC